MFKNKSVLFIIGAIVLSGILFGAYFMMNPSGKKVLISINGEVFGQYELNKDQTIKIDLGDGEYNIVQIKDNTVDMIESTCENQICVNDLPLQEGTPGVIVCLPHALIVEIED